MATSSRGGFFGSKEGKENTQLPNVMQRNSVSDLRAGNKSADGSVSFIKLTALPGEHKSADGSDSSIGLTADKGQVLTPIHSAFEGSGSQLQGADTITLEPEKPSSSGKCCC